MEASDWIKLLGVIGTQVVVLVTAGIAIWVKLAVLETTVKDIQRCLAEYGATHAEMRRETRERHDQIWKEVHRLRDRVARLESGHAGRRRRESDSDDDTNGS